MAINTSNVLYKSVELPQNRRFEFHPAVFRAESTNLAPARSDIVVVFDTAGTQSGSRPRLRTTRDEMNSPLGAQLVETCCVVTPVLCCRLNPISRGAGPSSGVHGAF